MKGGGGGGWKVKAYSQTIPNEVFQTKKEEKFWR